MMRHTLTSFRPATAAIAAVLVLATSPAIAQDAVALPPVDEPTPAPAPEVALPVLTPQVAQAPVIPAPSQATEVVQVTPVAAPETAAPATPRVQTRSQAPAAARTAQVAPAAVPAPAQTAPAPSAIVAPAAAPAPADAAPVPAPAVPAEPVAVNATDESLYWALGGGTVLLLGGFAAYALSNRRKPVTLVPVKERAAPPPLVTSSVKPADLSFEPVEVAAPAVAVEPEIAAAPATPRAARTTGSWSPLEEMVAAPPSPENPFVTRKARLRRANYILARGIPEPLQGDTPPVHQRAEEKQFKPQQAYNFGKAQNPPRFSWKPATT